MPEENSRPSKTLTLTYEQIDEICEAYYRSGHDIGRIFGRAEERKLMRELLDAHRTEDKLSEEVP